MQSKNEMGQVARSEKKDKKKQNNRCLFYCAICVYVSFFSISRTKIHKKTIAPPMNIRRVILTAAHLDNQCWTIPLMISACTIDEHTSRAWLFRSRIPDATIDNQYCYRKEPLLDKVHPGPLPITHNVLPLSSEAQRPEHAATRSGVSSSQPCCTKRNEWGPFFCQAVQSA